MPAIYISFFLLSSRVRSGHLAVQVVLILYSKFHNSFFPPRSITIHFSHFSIYHFVPSGSNLLLMNHSTARILKALSCLLTYSNPPSFWYPASKYSTVPLYSRYSLQQSSLIKPLSFFHGRVSTICSCRLKIEAVIPGSELHLNRP